jgi:hypothetical protein
MRFDFSGSSVLLLMSVLIGLVYDTPLTAMLLIWGTIALMVISSGLRDVAQPLRELADFADESKRR